MCARARCVVDFSDFLAALVVTVQTVVRLWRQQELRLAPLVHELLVMAFRKYLWRGRGGALCYNACFFCALFCV